MTTEAWRHAAAVVGRCAFVMMAIQREVGLIRVSHLHLSIHFIIVIAFKKNVSISSADAAVKMERRVHTLDSLSAQARQCSPS